MTDHKNKIEEKIQKAPAFDIYYRHFHVLRITGFGVSHPPDNVKGALYVARKMLFGEREGMEPILRGQIEAKTNQYPLSPTYGVHAALRYGEEKYGHEEYLNVPNLQYVYSQALFRHLFSEVYYPDSPDVDEESGLPHAYHAWACATIMVRADILGS